MYACVDFLFLCEIVMTFCLDKKLDMTWTCEQITVS